MNSWLDLELRFRNLVPALQHVRLDVQWGAAGEYWRLSGGGRTPASHEYEVLSGLGGRMLQRVLSESKESERALLAIADPKERWFNLLKSESPFFGARSYGQQLHEDGTPAGFIYTGTISHPAEAAAVLCLSLQVSHPIVEHKSRWQWLHENYVKGIVVGTVLAVVAAAVKWLGV